MPRREWTVVLLSPSGVSRKVAKIVPYRNGGFAVLGPYHSATSGLLVKSSMEAPPGTFWLPRQLTQTRSVNSRVKLSIHADGLIQFSGVDPGSVISGPVRLTRSPRGFGIRLHDVLTNPITTGPTFTLTLGTGRLRAGHSAR